MSAEPAYRTSSVAEAKIRFAAFDFAQSASAIHIES